MVRKMTLEESPTDVLRDLAGLARQSAGSPSGTIVTQNADGTKTILGEGAGVAGVAQWVGDTTPPGKPAGLSVSSVAGLVHVTWDGTLEGGVPADFSRIAIAAAAWPVEDGPAVGVSAVKYLTRAGTATFDEFEPGWFGVAYAFAFDDAHAEDGTPTPNQSPMSNVMEFTVASVVDQAEIDAMNQTLSEAAAELA
jgi:hypothetical protein